MVYYTRVRQLVYYIHNRRRMRILLVPQRMTANAYARARTHTRTRMHTCKAHAGTTQVMRIHGTTDDIIPAAAICDCYV